MNQQNMTEPREEDDEDSGSCTSGSSTTIFTMDINSRQSVTGSGDIDNGNENENTSEAIKAKLSKQSMWKVKMSGLLVIGILLMTAAATSAVVYIVAEKSEQNEFNAQYESASFKIMESFKDIVNRVGTINSIGIAATIEGLRDQNGYVNVTDTSTLNGTSTSTSWPYVTLPTFQQRTQTVRILAEVLYLAIHPLVSNKSRDAWEQYIVDKNAKKWISEGIQYQEQIGWGNFEYNPPSMDEVLMMNQTSQQIYYRNDAGEIVVAPNANWYLPRWQTSPILKKEPVNFDILNSNMKYSDEAKDSISKQRAVMGRFEFAPAGPINDTNYTINNMATLRSFANKKVVNYLGAPFANFYIPIFDSLNMNQERNVVAVMVARILLRQYLINILPANILGLTAVFEDSCSGNFTYEINGALADVKGPGDLHEPKFNTLRRIASFEINNTIYDGTLQGLSIDLDKCEYFIRVYPTQNFTDAYITNTPLLISLGVAFVFGFTIVAFILYNNVVESRQSAILDKAAHSTAIVSSLFPKQVRDRLLEYDDKPSNSSNQKYRSSVHNTDNDVPFNSPQIADLFPHCTVLFADIAGFTAWSSTRGPEHVFVMLQTIYQGFDQVARKRKVFKVETIGDSYLAATGLPEAQPAHAVLMARFAMECNQKMNEMTKELEVTLGPDCSELKMRFGMHSGPVTAGVLRGDRARFQLFGDTVNTAARMESTGIKGRIQLSQATADILIKSGKSHWVRPREDMVDAKGKGYLKTYWLNTSSSGSKASSETGSNSNFESTAEMSNTTQHEHGFDFIKRERLVDWVVEMLSEQIKQVIIKNEASGLYCSTSSVVPYLPQSGEICLDEVQEVIHLAKFDETIVTSGMKPSAFEMDPEALRQLRQYVQLIATMYHPNSFHNFEHACHVTLSVSKLLKRIVSPELSAEDLRQLKGSGEKELKAHLHASTYGINSDPLAQFAIVFSALIHDVDHRGCSNAQLAKEEEEMGVRYKNKSVAEQNSVDLSWSLLMSEQFDKLRKIIFGTQAELLRFRKLIVNSVLATDIFDKELNDLRKLRWEKAFAETSTDAADEHDVDRKATIVIEHIIQASDVSHTMQHWHVYRKWNTRLFQEMYSAYKAGRMAVDPSTFWYNGEISFFDNYIIPLAKKLKECNVFGVSSDEYLNYAVGNRDEWEHKGEALLEEIIREVTSCEELEN